MLKDISVDHNSLTQFGPYPATSHFGVRCSWNAISELDLSNKPNLQFVFCENSTLSVLELNNAPYC